MNVREEYIGYLEECIRGCKSRNILVHTMSVSNMEGILKLLKQPTLPEEPTEEMLSKMGNARQCVQGSEMWPWSYAAYKALYAALSTPSAPKTKRVKVWRVEWYDNIGKGTRSKSFHIPDQAYDEQKYLKLQEKRKVVSCINLIEDTQEVPDND